MFYKVVWMFVFQGDNCKYVGRFVATVTCLKHLCRVIFLFTICATFLWLVFLEGSVASSNQGKGKITVWEQLGNNSYVMDVRHFLNKMCYSLRVQGHFICIFLTKRLNHFKCQDLRLQNMFNGRHEWPSLLCICRFCAEWQHLTFLLA